MAAGEGVRASRRSSRQGAPRRRRSARAARPPRASTPKKPSPRPKRSASPSHSRHSASPTNPKHGAVAPQPAHCRRSRSAPPMPSCRSAPASTSSAWSRTPSPSSSSASRAIPSSARCMTIGSGGVLVELLTDTATLLLPARRDEIEAALRSLKLFPLLDGYRGRPKADIAAAIDAILAHSRFRRRQCRPDRRTRHQPADRLRATERGSPMPCWSAISTEERPHERRNRQNPPRGRDPGSHARPAEGQRDRPRDLAA